MLARSLFKISILLSVILFIGYSSLYSEDADSEETEQMPKIQKPVHPMAKLAHPKAVNPATEEEVEEDDSDEEDESDEKEDGSETSFLAQLFSGIRDADGSKVSSYVRDAQKAVEKLQEEVAKREGAFRQKAQERQEKTGQFIEERVSKMRVDTAAMAKKLQETAEQEIKQLVAQGASEIAKIQNELKKESILLKHQAAEQALNFVTEAEKKALFEKSKVRAETLKSKLGELNIDKSKEISKELRIASSEQSFSSSQSNLFDDFDFLANKRSVSESSLSQGPSISPEWKNEISKQFFDDMLLMKKIIIDGESQREANDFLLKFSEHDKWFNDILKKAKYVHDEYYKKIVSKQSKQHRIMDAQRRAMAMSKKMAKDLKLSGKQSKKINLTVLYDLSLVIQKRAAHPDPSIRELGLSDDDIKTIVKKATEESSVKYKQISGHFPDVKIVDKKTTNFVPATFQDEFNSTRNELLKTKEELEVAKQGFQKERLDKKHLKHSAKLKLHEKAKDAFEMEIKLRKSEKELSRLEKLMKLVVGEARTEKASKSELVNKVETTHKEKLELQLSLKKARRKILRTRKHIEESLTDKFTQLLEIKERSNLELKTQAMYADQKSQILENRAEKAVQENVQMKKHVEKVEDTAIQLQEKAREQQDMMLQSQERAKITEELARKTLNSVDQYISREKKALKVVQLQLQTKELELGKKRQKVEKEKSKTIKQKKILDNLRAETKKIIEESSKENESNKVELLKLQKDIELEFAKIKQETAAELANARKQLMSMKNNAKKKVQEAFSEIGKISQQKDQDIAAAGEELKKLEQVKHRAVATTKAVVKRVQDEAKKEVERANFIAMQQKLNTKKILDQPVQLDQPAQIKASGASLPPVGSIPLAGSRPQVK
jgi:hypothetical protein